MWMWFLIFIENRELEPLNTKQAFSTHSTKPWHQKPYHQLISLTALALSTVYLVSLSACATAPKTATLMTGISATDTAKSYADGQMRTVDDPVCVNFYNNAKTYIAEANKPNQGKNFLTRLGLGILAGVATGGIANAGINSTVGQIAAAQTVSTAVSQGGHLALQGLNKKSGPGAKVVKVAEQLHCPINLTT